MNYETPIVIKHKRTEEFMEALLSEADQRIAALESELAATRKVQRETVDRLAECGAENEKLKAWVSDYNELIDALGESEDSESALEAENERDIFYRSNECGYCGTRYDTWSPSFPNCPGCDTPMHAAALRDRIAALEEENERLREALRPFADSYTDWDNNPPSPFDWFAADIADYEAAARALGEM
jgi:hypothetical protein